MPVAMGLWSERRLPSGRNLDRFGICPPAFVRHKAPSAASLKSARSSADACGCV
jgi:hypothetical protein